MRLLDHAQERIEERLRELEAIRGRIIDYRRRNAAERPGDPRRMPKSA